MTSKAKLVLSFAIVVLIFVGVYFAPKLPSKTLAKKENIELDIKVNKATALVEGENPMEGIMLLREVLKEDSTHLLANWQMGLFSIQSKQYDKAIERFKKVVAFDVDKQFPDAQLMLARTYITLNDNLNAITSFEAYKLTVADTATVSRIDKFILELKQTK
jgi:Tfp pilus assembly protein PilF